MKNELRVFGGSANPDLTADICHYLEIEQGAIKLQRFADGELYPQFVENVRGNDVFIVQPTCGPVNDNLMELLLMINAAKLASAKRVTAVLPYYGYARQDRKDRPRVPISAKVVAMMLQSQKIKRVLTMDLHSAPIQGFFDVPVDHLYALPVFLERIKTNDLENLVIVSPDAGGTSRARMLAKHLGLPLVIIDKYRAEANVAEVMNVIGNVTGMNCLMIDDLIDTATTLVKGSIALMERGALSVRAAGSHAILSYDKKVGKTAYQKLDESPIVEVWVTDTIPHTDETNDSMYCSKIKTLTVAPLFAQAIRAIHEESSISSLFAGITN